MQFLSIEASNKSVDNILKFLTKELEQLNSYNIGYSIDIDIDKKDQDGNGAIICKINDSGDNQQNSRLSKQAFRSLMLNVSNALADYIMKNYEEKFIKKIIDTNYFYFNQFERKGILKEAFKVIKNEDKTFLNTLLQIRRRNIIVKKLMDYFDNSNTIILDGFINFRLKEYIKDLEEIVQKAVDNFLMEKEYREFINLLKYFVEIQEPKFYNVHVIVGENGSYTLLDEKMREITNECVKEYINEISEEEINYDDLLVSSLITLAPRKVTIHSARYFKNKELLETIKNVFYNNVIICDGCCICQVNTKAKKEK